ncbi:hypothetical protein IMT31_01845 [Citricoccus nitrophenolicus]
MKALVYNGPHDVAVGTPTGCRGRPEVWGVL